MTDSHDDQNEYSPTDTDDFLNLAVGMIDHENITGMMVLDKYTGVINLRAFRKL
jgi:hypothetical protein